MPLSVLAAALPAPPDVCIHIIFGIKYTVNILIPAAFIRITNLSAGIPIETPNVFSANRIYGYRYPRYILGRLSKSDELITLQYHPASKYM